MDGEKINIIRTNQKRELSLIERKLYTLLNLKINESISDEEYDKKRKELIEDKKSLELALNKLPNLARSNQQTLDFLNFTIDLKNKFDSGNDEIKRNILSIVGANLYLRDRKLEIQLEKPFFIMNDGCGDNKGISGKTGRCEPLEDPIKKGTYEDFSSVSPSLLRGQGSNLRPCG